MHEHIVKKDMAPLLFWLRLRLRVQGTRNDIHDKDRGFGAWIEENLDITRRTSDRGAPCGLGPKSGCNLGCGSQSLDPAFAFVALLVASFMALSLLWTGALRERNGRG